jgi:hypothetical protein
LVVGIELLDIGIEDTLQLVKFLDRLDHALLSECPDEPPRGLAGETASRWGRS